MRNRVLLALIMAVTLAGACDPGPASFDQALKADLAKEVRETLAGLTDAMNAHDSERVFGYFRNNEEFLYLGCTDFLLGFGAFSVRVGPYYETNPEVVFHQEVVRIQVLSPNVAVAALRGGSTEIEDLFWTEVLVKEDGNWVIAHEHESWPGCSPPSAVHDFGDMPEMGDLDSIGLQEGGTGGP